MQNGLTVLVCGSSDFNNRTFVHASLASLSNLLNVSCIVSGEFTGVAQFAKEWATEHNIKYKSLNLLSDLDLAAFDGSVLPKAVLQIDDSAQHAKMAMLSAGVKLVMPFPNESGELGATTSNLTQIAELIGITVMNASYSQKHLAEIYPAYEAVDRQINKEVEKQSHRKKLGDGNRF